MAPPSPKAPSLDRARALFRAWDGPHGAAPAEVRAMEEAVLARLAVDGPRFSDVLEASFSWQPETGGSFRRFSYALPAFRAEPEACARALEAMAAPLGAVARKVAGQIARAARQPVVAQPLFGFADDGPRGRRGKLYLQLRDGAGFPRAAELVRAVTGIAVEPGRLAPDESLHMIGLDLGEGGLREVKLYAAAERQTEPLGLRSNRVLSVYRIADPAAGVPAQPAELDWGLDENGLDERSVIERVAAGYSEAWKLFSAEMAPFSVRIRRVSIGLQRPKLTIYYVIAG